jgi:hypothetical protein
MYGEQKSGDVELLFKHILSDEARWHVIDNPIYEAIWNTVSHEINFLGSQIEPFFHSMEATQIRIYHE